MDPNKVRKLVPSEDSHLLALYHVPFLGTSCAAAKDLAALAGAEEEKLRILPPPHQGEGRPANRSPSGELLTSGAVIAPPGLPSLLYMSPSRDRWVKNG